MPAYARVLLKLSGEALMGQGGYGIDPKVMKQIATQIRDVRDLGVTVPLSSAAATYTGASARKSRARSCNRRLHGHDCTVMNAVALQDCLESLGLDTRVQTAIQMAQVAEPYIRSGPIVISKKGGP